MEYKEIGIKFENQPKIYSFNPINFNLKIGDFVVVETVRGMELGKVATEIKILKNQPNEPLKNIIRKATAEDIKSAEENKEKVKIYFEKAKEIAGKLQLEMKIVNAELTLDCNKIIISFTSEKRVDFRELVKILAGEFRMKIELRQIGSRDEVKIKGGIGICGRPCCCQKNTGDFEHVTIKMAKMQGLSLNPSNISGLCGRLMCCLGYENDQYAEIFKAMPRINSEVKTVDGFGKVLYNNILKKTVQVRVDDEFKEYNLDDITVLKPNQIVEE